LKHPTRSAKARPSRARTVEERTWPEHARILSLMSQGFGYTEAWHMSPRDWRRYTAISAAASIPSDDRVTTVIATPDMIGMLT
jgi:hypothetical protein